MRCKKTNKSQIAGYLRKNYNFIFHIGLRRFFYKVNYSITTINSRYSKNNLLFMHILNKKLNRYWGIFLYYFSLLDSIVNLYKQKKSLILVDQTLFICMIKLLKKAYFASKAFNLSFISNAR